MQYKSVLPEGWYAELLEKADLEGSFTALDGWTHPYVDGMRGRIRSLQLRLDEAWDYMENALRRGSDEPTTVPNLARQFVLQMYLFENALLAQAVDRSAPAPPLRVPDFPDSLIEEYPEIRYILDGRIWAEATLRLHLGDYHEACTLFEGLARSYEKPPDATVSIYHAGHAAAQFNLGLEAEARHTLETAGLCLQAGGKTLNCLRAAAVLVGTYAFFDDGDAAEEWRHYIDRVECPTATKEVFVKRSIIILQRCLAQRCVLIL